MCKVVRDQNNGTLFITSFSPMQYLVNPRLVVPKPNMYINIYCYTPLPLNLTNKQQQATSKHCSVPFWLLLRLITILAIQEPRWCPCQIQVLSQKRTGGAPGQGRQVGRCPPKTAHFVPQNSLFFFGPKRPQSPFKSTKRRETVATLHVRLDLPVTRSPLLPSNSTICPRNGPQKKGPECA